jgi:hypothetical protein
MLGSGAERWDERDTETAVYVEEDGCRGSDWLGGGVSEEHGDWGAV